MKLTGKQLFEWWAGAIDDALAMNLKINGTPFDQLSLYSRNAWDVLAEKLNGMMAGEPVIQRVGPIENLIIKPGEVVAIDDNDRARHHATCPYRHGKGNCNCGPTP